MLCISLVGSPGRSTWEALSARQGLRTWFRLASKCAGTIFNPVGCEVLEFCWCHSFNIHLSVNNVELSCLLRF